MPMNLKDEIVAGESYALEFKRVPNKEREKYLKTVVAVDEAAFATQMNVYRVTDSGNEGNEDNREGNEDNRADNEDNRNDSVGVADQILIKLKSNARISVRQLAGELPVSKATIERTLRKLEIADRIRRRGGTRGVWEVL